MTSERRLRRSSDPLVALHYQLAETRKRGGFEAVVLTDATGMVVAGSGAWPICEELAAFAPFAGNAMDRESLPGIAREMVVHPVPMGGQDVLLCARGEHGVEAESALTAASQGIHRILAA